MTNIKDYSLRLLTLNQIITANKIHQTSSDYSKLFIFKVEGRAMKKMHNNQLIKSAVFKDKIIKIS